MGVVDAVAELETERGGSVLVDDELRGIQSDTINGEFESRLNEYRIEFECVAEVRESNLEKGTRGISSWGCEDYGCLEIRGGIVLDREGEGIKLIA